MIFESHAHYNDHKFDEDREEVIESLKNYDVCNVINVGDSLASSKECMKLADRYDFIYAAVGIHPENVADAGEDYKNVLQDMINENKKVVSVGEIGLDYYWEKDLGIRERQKNIFRGQIELALANDLPIIIHSRDACEDTLDILYDYRGRGLRGVMHCYSYSPEVAADLINKMNFFIGVGGVVTFKNAKKLKETVEKVGLEHILLETDCPYMAPEPNRGKRNFSGYIPFVVDEIARLKCITREEVEAVTEKNARDLFRVY